MEGQACEGEQGKGGPEAWVNDGAGRAGSHGGTGVM